MSNCFNILPTELVQEILSYIDVLNYQSVYHFYSFRKILDNPHFWRPIYRSEFTEVDFLICNEFDTLDFYNYYTDYIKLKQVYSKALNLLNTTDIFYDDQKKRYLRKNLIEISLKNIKNFKVLNLEYTKELSEDLQGRIVKFWLNAYNTGDPNFTLTVMRDFYGYKFSIDYNDEILQYKVMKRDVLNLYLHLFYCNLL